MRAVKPEDCSGLDRTEMIGHSLSAKQSVNFRFQAANLVADDIDFASLAIVFDGNSPREQYHVTADNSTALRSDLIGIIETADKNLSSAVTSENFEQLAADRFDMKLATLKQKIRQIETTLIYYPARKSTLFGDSGERDPEVYSQIRKRFPEQIQDIWIRDVVNARTTTSSRLDNMNIIRAPTIERGVSQLPDV